RVRPLPAFVAVEAGMPRRPFRVADYLGGLAKAVEMHRWPKKVSVRAVTLEAQTQAAAADSKEQGGPLQPDEAAGRVLVKLGLGGTSFAHPFYDGPIEDGSGPALPADPTALAVVACEPDGRMTPAALAAVSAVQVVAGTFDQSAAVLLFAPLAGDAQRRAV